MYLRPHHIGLGKEKNSNVLFGQRQKDSDRKRRATGLVGGKKEGEVVVTGVGKKFGTKSDKRRIGQIGISWSRDIYMQVPVYFVKNQRSKTPETNSIHNKSGPLSSSLKMIEFWRRGDLVGEPVNSGGEKGGRGVLKSEAQR